MLVHIIASSCGFLVIVERGNTLAELFLRRQDRGSPSVITSPPPQFNGPAVAESLV